MASRSRSRQFAVQLLYQLRLSGYSLEKVISLFWDSHDADDKTKSFCESLVTGVVDQSSELDLEITEYLNQWTLDRIAKIDHIILQIAMFELQSDPSIPWKVVVDEAVNLTQSFSCDKSVSFVNGVLHAWCETNRQDVKE